MKLCVLQTRKEITGSQPKSQVMYYDFRRKTGDDRRGRKVIVMCYDEKRRQNSMLVKDMLALDSPLDSLHYSLHFSLHFSLHLQKSNQEGVKSRVTWLKYRKQNFFMSRSIWRELHVIPFNHNPIERRIKRKKCTKSGPDALTAKIIKASQRVNRFRLLLIFIHVSSGSQNLMI